MEPESFVSLEKELESLKELLALEEKIKRLKILQEKMSQPNFWQTQKEANSVVEELKRIKDDIDGWKRLEDKFKELRELSLLMEPAYQEELKKEIDTFKEELERLKIKALFGERFDEANAIIEINAGAGGTESCDWVGMLFRMYFRWAEDKGLRVRILDELKAEEAGFKNITFLVEGERAYGMLKAERGVHRLVRISPFDANKRRHTSFASVDVLPQIKEEKDFTIKPEELRIETFRASGRGGQHVNRTDSAVRITHLPTGLVVSCQNERSQHQNKQLALSILKAKLYNLREEERKRDLEKLAGQKQRIEWGSQIRSYVLYPYLLVKDHRTDFETADARSVLDGKLDDFIFAYLKKKAQGAEC